MTETMTDESIRVGKETKCYGENQNDYIAPREIAVTITLCEYRELVEKNAKSDKTICEVKESYESRIRDLNTDLTFYKAQVERLQEALKPNSYSDEDKGSD